MKKGIVFLFCITALLRSFAQQPQETARTFMQSGDWDNAILVLSRALQQDANNLSLQKDLALAYFYKRDYSKALQQIKPILNREDADVATFQIGGNIYKALEEVKDADKMYKKGLKKFPKSGPLYSEYGELLWANQNYDAIKQWEKGIEADPSYAGNYYNAAVYYYYTKDKIWTILYGEIFINMEYLSDRAAEMKKLLLKAYKEKLFTIDTEKLTKNTFSTAVIETFNKQASLVNQGISSATLSTIRTRFASDWSKAYATKFPFRLFDYYQQLMREGIFEAYNQWLFGAVDNQASFTEWTKTNSAAYNKFIDFQKGRIFKMPTGQHYSKI